MSCFTPLAKKVLNLDKNIRWVGIANNFGVLLNTEHREGLKPFLTEEENEDYASLTVTRHKTRTKFEPKVGKLNLRQRDDIRN